MNFRSLLLRSVAALAVFVSAAATTNAQCATTVTLNGVPRIGTQVQLVISGPTSCHACLWISKNPGPTMIGNIVIPIGLPLLNFADLGPLPMSGQVVTPVNIPNDPNLIGLQLFFTNVSYPAGQVPSPTNVMFSPALTVTIQP